MPTTIHLRKSIRAIVASPGYGTDISSARLPYGNAALIRHLPAAAFSSRTQDARSTPFRSRTPKASVSPAVLAILLLILLLPAGCDKKDGHKTSHPDKGAVAGTTEWSQRGEDVAIPAQYRVEAAGNTATANGTAFVVPGLFEPGTVEVLAYNLPAGVSVNDGIATINTMPDAAANAAADGTPPTLLIPDAGVFFSGTATADAIADDTVRITLPMHQRMRRIHFTLTVTEGDPERIASVESRLEGVAAAIELRTGEVTGDSTAVRIPFARTADRLTADVWTAGIVVEATHRIVTTLTFSDGHHITTIADVTDLLRNFNADKLTPLDVTGSLFAPVGAGPNGTIIDWTSGNGKGDDVDANM
ncbi:hypothetical protein [Parabacteroides chongii]|uniref:hypothetical protein n=1 Tax=Parabacteroides chongii TaxID=2685834 RepID=UPI00240CFB8E|nr:hypothetical protein [Parabacteroides chongii]WFE84400.1 hypothetical protein P3L47_20030 [Parabacteroides chongii]